MRPNTARNADINTQITETVRMRHDLYRQVTNTNIDIENVLLTKRSYEARGQEYFTNQAYFDALKVAEERARALENNRIEARRAERVLVLTRIFNSHYTKTITDILIKDMPEVVFRPSDAGPAAEVAIQRLARRVVANEPSHNVYAETRRIWDFIHEMENAVAVYPDDTPEFIINDQRVLVVNDARTEFYPFKYIYVRQCYEDLLPKIMDTAKDSVVTILGDSGIGTSTFLRYLFANIIVNPKYKQKVFWQRESGFWRYFDGETRHCGVEDTDVWRKPDVLLLLDGTLQPKHYQKLKNVLIVCSLESENYDRMIKASSDVAFVMPCWSIEEVKKVSNISVETVAGNFVVTSNILSENMKVFYDNLRQQVAPLVPQASENPADSKI